MQHRSARGLIGYFHRRNGVTGREYFAITRHSDGVRTLRAQCEMDDDEVLRDVTFSVDGRWRPLDAFVRLTVRDRFVGSSWFRFHHGGAECEGFTATEGRISQRVALDAWPAYFGTHSLVTDGWHAALWREGGPEVQRFPSLITSHAANGATGPVIAAGTAALQLAGRETLRVPAGEFDSRHFLITFGSFATPMHFWVTGEDHQILRIEWDHLDAYYELLEYSAS